MEAHRQPITIAGLARRMRVSPATVSKALNGRDDVAEETRQKILSEARRLNMSLPRRRSRRRGARKGFALVSFGMTPQVAFGHYPFARLIHAIQTEVGLDGGELVLELAAGDQPNCFKNRSVDGVILLGGVETEAQARLLRELPVVCAPDPVAQTELDSVCQDNTGGARRITRHLIDRGHRRIAFVSHTWQRPVFIERAAGYQAAMYESQLEPLVLRASVDHRQCAREFAGSLSASDVTAVVAVNDNLAADLVGRLSMMGRALPEEISVVGFDHWPQQDIWAGMPLTTVDGNLDDVGRQAVELLRYRAQHHDGAPLRVTVAPQIVEGKSVAPPRD